MSDTVGLDDTETEALLGFIRLLKRRLSDASCNERLLTDTPANREMVKAAHGGGELHFHIGLIETDDVLLLNHLARRFRESVEKHNALLQISNDLAKERNTLAESLKVTATRLQTVDGW